MSDKLNVTDKLAMIDQKNDNKGGDRSELTDTVGSSPYYDLFELLDRDHGLVLVESELDDIVNVAVKISKRLEIEEEQRKMREYLKTVQDAEKAAKENPPDILIK